MAKDKLGFPAGKELIFEGSKDTELLRGLRIRPGDPQSRPKSAATLAPATASRSRPPEKKLMGKVLFEMKFGAKNRD